MDYGVRAFLSELFRPLARRWVPGKGSFIAWRRKSIELDDLPLAQRRELGLAEGRPRRGRPESDRRPVRAVNFPEQGPFL